MVKLSACRPINVAKVRESTPSSNTNFLPNFIVVNLQFSLQSIGKRAVRSFFLYATKAQ